MNENMPPRKGKKGLWITVGVLTFLAIVGAASNNSGTQSVANTAVQANQFAPLQSAPTAVQPISAPAAVQTPAPSLSNDNYYVNSSGNTVHSPAYSANDEVPAGATARCADGTYSFSEHRQGTCSHHGGVAEWL